MQVNGNEQCFPINIVEILQMFSEKETAQDSFLFADLLSFSLCVAIQPDLLSEHLLTRTRAAVCDQV